MRAPFFSAVSPQETCRIGVPEHDNSVVANRPSDPVLAQRARPRDFMPLKALCALVPEGQEEQVLEEGATVLREARDSERIRTLLTGTPVRFISVTAVPPGDLLARLATCRQEDGSR